MIRLNLLLMTFTAVLSPLAIKSCEKNAGEEHIDTVTVKYSANFRVMNYNVENLFDTEDDPQKDDEDFLPDGRMHWTKGRYHHKLEQIAHVINRVGKWEMPALVGLQEVESAQTLHDLIAQTPLCKQGYKFLITNSPDRRGIDVGLLYRPEQFDLIRSEEFVVSFRKEPDKKTRNILYAVGRLPNNSLLHVMVCHLPSRREGAKATAIFRREAALLIRKKCDSVAVIDPKASFLIMGDFNGDPNEAATVHELEAGLRLPKHLTPEAIPEYPPQLYNLFGEHTEANPAGSYVYQGTWTQLDQIIISESVLLPSAAIQYIKGSAHTVYEPYLLFYPKEPGREPMPNRTYVGSRYNKDGFSDHLPIVADFIIR